MQVLEVKMHLTYAIMQAMLEWSDLRFFLAIWRTGTLSAAARKLKVNQTTVGRRLVALEEALAARLFDRTLDGHVLTASGERVLAIAQSMEDSIASIERTVVGEDVRLEGTVRLSTNEVVGQHYLVEHVDSFRTHYQGIHLELVIGTSPLNLLKREADIALRTSPGKPSAQQDIIARRLSDIGWGLYASSKYLRRVRATTPTTRSLAGHALIGYEGELAGLGAQKWLEENGSRATFVMHTNSIHQASYAVEAGVGVAALPCIMAPRLRNVERFSKQVIVTVGLWLLVHPDLLRSARVRAVMDHLVEHYGAGSPELAGKAPADGA